MIFYKVCVLAVVVVIDNLNMKLMEEYRLAYDSILKGERLSPRAIYVRSKGAEEYQLNFTAYGVFDLNKNSILNYLSALVTFTVLFMQLNRVI
ncbi:hypothetical protein HDE_00186 [Halotydeus destructor]|nr:hypothetical protein HDE_00186 [Halotydeus destructor]